MNKPAKIAIITACSLLGVAAIVGTAVGWKKLANKAKDAITEVQAATIDWSKQKYDLNYETPTVDSTKKTATLLYTDNDDNQIVKVPGTVTVSGTVYTVTDVSLSSQYAIAAQIPDSVVTFNAGNGEDSANFSSKNLKYVELGKGVTNLTNTFCGCRSLREVRMLGNVSFIGDNAFNGTAIESFVVPETVTSFGWAFPNSSLKELTFASDQSLGGLNLSGYLDLEKVTLPKNNKGEINLSGDVSLESVTLPEGTTKAFLSGCVKLGGVIAPSAVEQIVCDKLPWLEIKAPTYTVTANAINKNTPVFFDAYKAKVTWASLATERTDADQKVYYKGQWKLVRGVPTVIDGAEPAVEAATSSASALN